MVGGILLRPGIPEGNFFTKLQRAGQLRSFLPSDYSEETAVTVLPKTIYRKEKKTKAGGPWSFWLWLSFGLL